MLHKNIIRRDRDRIEITNLEHLYQIKEENGKRINCNEADGRQLFNHYRHNMTNYDRVLDRIRTEQGHVTGKQEKKAAIGAAKQILEIYRNKQYCPELNPPQAFTSELLITSHENLDTSLQFAHLYRRVPNS